jgi:hypothetical protein
MAETSKLTKTERSELKSLIKQRFRVLREEVDQRRAELLSELENQIGDRYSEDDKAWADAAFLIEEAAREANRKANDVMRGLLGDRWPGEKLLVYGQMPRRPASARSDLRIAGAKRVEAQVKAARHALSRQEVDLLTELTADAIESDAAMKFLRSIPTVSELVPAVRLLELEASLQEGTDG